MKVGHEIRNNTKFVSWQYHEIGCTRRGFDGSPASQGLQSSHDGGAYGDDGPTLGLCTPDTCRSHLTNHEALAVQPMLRRIASRDRAKGTRADVQSDTRQLVPCSLDLGQKFRCEMQTSRRSRNRPRCLGVDGLVANPIVDWFECPQRLRPC